MRRRVGRPSGGNAAYRRAFTDIFGDPFAQPEAIPGYYQTLRNRGVLAAMKNNFGEGKATRNPATPNVIDFFCDVEHAVKAVLSEEEQTRFIEIYIWESADGTAMERISMEHRIGRLLRENGISPARKYFTSVRRALHK